MLTLQQLVDQAIEQANQDAAPFAPSHAQVAERLQPVVNQVLALPRSEGRAMFNGIRVGSWDMHVLAEFKSAISLGD